MSRIHDEEDLIVNLKNYVRDNINTQIEAINVEKSDSMLESINPIDKYFLFGAVLVDIPNHPFVSFSFEPEIEMVTNYNDTLSIPKINIEYAFANQRVPNTYIKSLRYMRAIKQTVLNFESSAQEVGELIIEKSLPTVILVNTLELVVSGVGVSISIS